MVKSAIHQALIHIMNRSWPWKEELHEELELENLLMLLEDSILNDRKSLQLNRKVVRAYNHIHPILNLNEIDEIIREIDSEEEE
tara:strand:- start:712 stop:963 length:252 start_codon:yes stop_codon:yes gene_type:complete